MYYVIYAEFAFSGIYRMDKFFRTKQEFYTFIGNFYLGSTERIISIQYETFTREELKYKDFIINRGQYI